MKDPKSLVMNSIIMASSLSVQTGPTCRLASSDYLSRDYEARPNNPRKSGLSKRALENYKKSISNEYGGRWRTTVTWSNPYGYLDLV